MQLAIRRRPADHIWQWRRITYAVGTALVLLAIGGVFVSVSDPSTTVPVSSEPTFLEPNRAFRAAEDLADRYPERPMGSNEARNAAQWYETRLQELQIPSYSLESTVPWDSGEVVLRNILVVLPGQDKDAILVSAPRDTPTPGVSADAGAVSPLSGASGTAILLDLIQVFAARPHEKTLIFLSSEGGGAGGLGVAQFLEEDVRGADVRVILSFYGLGRERRDELLAGVSGADTSTPGWLVQLVTATLSESDVTLRLPDLPSQVADHALRLARGEQVAGLRRNVPALLLYDEGPGPVTSAGIGSQGTLIERMLLSLDSGTEVPTDPGTALVLTSGRYFTSRSLTILGLLMLLPGGVMSFTWLVVNRTRPETWARYLRNLLSFVLPLAAMLPVVWLAGQTGLMPLYPAQAGPTTQAANHVDPLTAAMLFAVAMLLFLTSRHYLGYLRPREPLLMSETIKLSLGLLLLVVGLALLATHSPFSVLTAVTAAWIWPLATCFVESHGTLLLGSRRLRTNRPLLLLGLLAPALLYVYLVYSTELVWWQGWWFLLVETTSGTYGGRGPLAFVLITAAFLQLLGVKRLRLRPVETLEGTEHLVPTRPPSPRVRKVRRPAVPPPSSQPPAGEDPREARS
jgi:hypothetical protein